MPRRQAAFDTAGRTASCRPHRLASAPPWQVTSRKAPRTAGAGVAAAASRRGKRLLGDDWGDDWGMPQSYTQKIRPARAPKGPGRPFSSERGKGTGAGWRNDRFAMVERVPERTQSTTCSAVALLLLGDLLGSLLLLLRHCDGSLPRAPALLHDHSPGCSVGGNGRRCASRRSEPNTALRRCMATLHRAAQKSCEG